MADITQVWATNYQDGSVYGASWVDTSAKQSMVAGYGYNYKNWVICIKFVLPTAAKSFTFNFHNHTGNSGQKAVMRYKITTSEDDSLVNATASTTGDGTFTMNTGDYTFNSVTVTRHMSAGAYYMYIWTDKTTTFPNNWMRIRWYPNEYNAYGFYATYEESNNFIYIDNGSSFDAYEIYIDNGTSWDLYQAYIDNGSGWDECG